MHSLKEASAIELFGPVPDDELWEFGAGEVVQCHHRDGQLVAVRLVQEAGGQVDVARPLSLQPGRTQARRHILAGAIARAIDEADPIGLLRNGAPGDEYAAELGTILPRLPSANGVEDVAVILHE